MCSLISLQVKLHFLQIKQALLVNLGTVLIISLFLMGGKKCFDLKTLDLQTDVWNVTHFQVGYLPYSCTIYLQRLYNTIQFNYKSFFLDLASLTDDTTMLSCSIRN
jgi:hypothetical protein